MKRILLFILISCLFINAFAQDKRALVIGVGKQLDSSWGKINGDKDIPYICTMLKDAGFSKISTLENEQATKEKIIEGLAELARKCQKSDVVYIHFSGHGQQMTDMHGDETSDRWDECWIPYDAYSSYSQSYNGSKHLTDDEIFFYINKISGKIGNEGKLLLVVDACHSGDSFYDDKQEVIRGTSRKFIIPKSTTNLMNDKFINRSKYNNWIMLSACKEYEVNAEMKEPIAGKLTYALYVLLRNNKTYMNELLLYRIKLFMDKNTDVIHQTPEYGGDEKAFNISEIFIKK